MRDFRPITINLELFVALTDARRVHRLTKRAMTEYGIRLVLAGLDAGSVDPADIAGYRIPAPPKPRKRNAAREVTVNANGTHSR